MFKSKYKIGIVDGLFYSLQARLLAEGHRVKVYIPDAGLTDVIPSKAFNQTPVSNHKNISHVLDISDLYDCDFVICETLNDEYCFENLKLQGVPTIGHSTVACLLEKDRSIGKMVIEQATKQIKGFKIPKTVEFNDVAKAKEFLLNSPTKQVIKQSRLSPKEAVANPTVVIEDPKSFVSELDKPNAWFVDGKGGCIFEQKIEGQEVCFGAWFNGEEFILPMYSCIEHKGAQNGDRGAVLTGEVGTTLEMHTNADSRMFKVFQSIEPWLAGQCVGMIDINTILTPNGDQYFLEFTCRFGRPTLDMQMAKLKATFNLGLGLYKLALKHPAADTEEYWLDAYLPGYTVGTTIFTYGLSVLDGLIEAAPEEMRDTLNALLPHHNTKIVLDRKFDWQPINNKRTGSCSHLQQMFAAYNHEEKVWMLNGCDRHFIAVGHHPFDAEIASKISKGLADAIKIHGCTHRDDVGANLPNLSLKLKKLGIA